LRGDLEISDDSGRNSGKASGRVGVDEKGEKEWDVEGTYTHESGNVKVEGKGHTGSGGSGVRVEVEARF